MVGLGAQFSKMLASTLFDDEGLSTWHRIPALVNTNDGDLAPLKIIACMEAPWFFIDVGAL